MEDEAMPFINTKMITKRGWILRATSLVGIGFVLFVYYMSSPSNSSLRLQRSKLVNDNEMEDTSNIFSKLLYSDDGRQKTIDGVVRRHGRDPRKNLKHKVVHFDLKGMPPLMRYYKELFPLLKQYSVTDVLIEYEDMFPYHGRLKDIQNREAYSKADIKQLNKLAKLNDIQIIPLIQTFGHLEFLLKVERFMDLREVPRLPQAICPTNNQSNDVIREMIDQVMSLHPGIEYIHIGSDEVYQIGQCSLCIERMFKYTMDTGDIFLDHVSRVAQYIKDSYDVKPLMWDDQFRTLDESLITKYGLGTLVEIIVWDYFIDVRIPSQLWDKYARTFQSVWIGSAFKGADEPNSMVVNETMYLSNHYSWIKVLQEQESRISFQGIMMTGWQRYDHFSVPCELLPAAIPSLVSCLTFLNSSRFIRMDDVFTNVSDVLDCTTRLDFCHFPGSAVHQEIKHLHRLKMNFQRIQKSNIYKGWVNKANLLLRFSSPSYLDSIYYEISSIRNDLNRAESQLEASLREIYPEWSVNEWMTINFKPFSEEINFLFDKINKILERKHFPVRPLLYSDGYKDSPSLRGL